MATVIITDDSQLMRTYLKDIFTSLGMSVLEAENGIQLLKLLKDVKPDLITLDITLPYITGIETLKRIRENDSKTPIIMLSSMGQKPMIIYSLKCGANDFIVKPFNKEQVIESVQKFIDLT